MLLKFYFVNFTIIFICFVIKWHAAKTKARQHSYLYQPSKNQPKLSADFNCHAYESIDKLFTACELRFYRALEQVIPDSMLIFGKVRIADVLKPKEGFNGQERYKIFGKICAKHLDYVICDKRSLNVICCIELHDQSHQRADRIERDVFVRKIFKSSGVKLIEITAKGQYNLKCLRKDLKFLF